MKYEEWLKSVPMEMTGDPLWTVEAYRLALFAADLGWHDVTKLMKDKRTMGLADLDRTNLDAFLQSDAPLP